MSKRQTVKTTWECWTYDVWGNARDGYPIGELHCVFHASLSPIREGN